MTNNTTEFKFRLEKWVCIAKERKKTEEEAHSKWQRQYQPKKLSSLYSISSWARPIIRNFIHIHLPCVSHSTENPLSHAEFFLLSSPFNSKLTLKCNAFTIPRDFHKILNITGFCVCRVWNENLYYKLLACFFRYPMCDDYNRPNNNNI